LQWSAKSPQSRDRPEGASPSASPAAGSSGWSCGCGIASGSLWSTASERMKPVIVRGAENVRPQLVDFTTITASEL